MKKTFIIPISLFFVAFVIFIFLSTNTCINIVYYYEKNVRGYLFFGFLTIGSFLLSLKTLILFTLKEKFYDSPTYHQDIEHLYNLDENFSPYLPLIRLGKLLLYTVLLSLIASVLHFSLGFTHNIWLISFCLSFSISVFSLVFFCWHYIRISLDHWFNTLP